MFRDAKQLARAALEILDASSLGSALPTSQAALELGAAVLASHVRDWHVATGVVPDIDQFRAQFPEWEPLRQISNGTKHAKPIIADLSHADFRPVEWEDADFWLASHERPILFVEVAGQQRAVSALVRGFVLRYLASP